MNQNDLEQSLRRSICDIGRRMYAREMGAANDGNISVKLDEERLLCTPSGVSKGFMSPEILCIVDYEGQVLDAHPEHSKPSSELKMHLRAYRERPDISAVVHGHPLYATAFAVCGKPLNQQIMPEATISLGEVPVAPFALPSTEDLPRSIAPYLASHDAVLLENHGAVTVGINLQAAYFKLETLEFYAKVLHIANSMGGPNAFDEQTLEQLVNLRRDRFKKPGRHPLIDG
ncbi:class II aldolase/adducin family protein [Salinisphaera sp. T31B1]|uniref:class II aldolase/adducin family protein n=1 Tax=Salinisphaera sp. T31B1 TaxID=727963 RepID=UPI003340984F